MISPFISPLFTLFIRRFLAQGIILVYFTCMVVQSLNNDMGFEQGVFTGKSYLHVYSKPNMQIYFHRDKSFFSKTSMKYPATLLIYTFNCLTLVASPKTSCKLAIKSSLWNLDIASWTSAHLARIPFLREQFFINPKRYSIGFIWGLLGALKKQWISLSLKTLVILAVHK